MRIDLHVTRSTAAASSGQSLPGFIIAAGVELARRGAQQRHAELALLGREVGRMVDADAVLVADRAAAGDHRLATPPS